MRETADQHKACLIHECERKQKKRAEETDENHETQLESNRKRKKQRLLIETSEKHKKHLNNEYEKKCVLRISNNQRCQRIEKTDIRPKSQTISKNKHQILQNFCNRMDNIQYYSCPICNK